MAMFWTEQEYIYGTGFVQGICNTQGLTKRRKLSSFSGACSFS